MDLVRACRLVALIAASVTASMMQLLPVKEVQARTLGLLGCLLYRGNRGRRPRLDGGHQQNTQLHHCHRRFSRWLPCSPPTRSLHCSTTTTITVMFVKTTVAVVSETEGSRMQMESLLGQSGLLKVVIFLMTAQVANLEHWMMAAFSSNKLGQHQNL